MILDREQLQDFLNPLGIVVVSNDFQPVDYGHWLMTSFGQKAGLKFDNKMMTFAWEKLDDLVNDICGKGMAFVVWQYDDKHQSQIQNPYLGCKSLEEMEIRKDLACIQ